MGALLNPACPIRIVQRASVGQRLKNRQSWPVGRILELHEPFDGLLAMQLDCIQRAHREDTIDLLGSRIDKNPDSHAAALDERREPLGNKRFDISFALGVEVQPDCIDLQIDRFG